MELRKGMWVVAEDGRVAIYTQARRLVDPLNPQLGFANVPELHYVDDAGNTILIGPMTNVRQAKAAEIPAVRVAHLSPEQLGQLGYA